MENYQIDVEKLLGDKRVIAEIQRHLWIESEKSGYDIGFEKAKEDWLKKFSVTWMEYHMPEELLRQKKAPAAKPAESTPSEKASSEKASKSAEAASLKRRRAKSYLF